MELFRIIATAVITAIAVIIVREYRPDFAFVITVSGVIILLLFSVDYMQTAIEAIREIAALTGIENSFLKILLKIIGIGYLVEFAASILTDFGSASLADKVTFVGKLVIFSISLPIVKAMLVLVQNLASIVS